MTKFIKWLTIIGVFSATCVIVIPTATVLTINSESKNSNNAPKTLKDFQTTLNSALSNISGVKSIMPSQLTTQNFTQNVTGFPIIPQGIVVNPIFLAQSSSTSANGLDDSDGTANVSFSISQDGYTLTTHSTTIVGFQTTIENQFNQNISISLNNNFIQLPNPSPTQGIPAKSLPSYFNVQYLNNISSNSYNFSRYQISLIAGSPNSVNLKIWAYTGNASNLFAATFLVKGFVIPDSTNGLIAQYVNYVNNSEVGTISFNSNIQKLLQLKKLNADNFSNSNLLAALNIDSIPSISSIINQTNFANVAVTVDNWNSQTLTFSIILTNNTNQNFLSTSVISIQISN